MLYADMWVSSPFPFQARRAGWQWIFRCNLGHHPHAEKDWAMHSFRPARGDTWSWRGSRKCASCPRWTSSDSWTNSDNFWERRSYQWGVVARRSPGHWRWFNWHNLLHANQYLPFLLFFFFLSFLSFLKFCERLPNGGSGIHRHSFQKLLRVRLPPLLLIHNHNQTISCCLVKMCCS